MNEALQTDPAPPALPTAPTCTHCRSSFGDHYFQANGTPYCESCANSLRGALAGQGSSAGRFIRAILLGSGAAALSAIGYGIFMGLTNIEFALVTIVMGWFIGSSVRKGSGGRGGWRYGLLAVLLTYFAIAFSYFGVAVSGELGKREAPAPAPAPALAHKAAADPSAETSPAATDATDADPSVEGSEKVPRNPAVLLLMLFAFALAAPVAVATQSILSAVIIGFGLWKAWTMNRAVQLEITGPHPLDQLAPAQTA